MGNRELRASARPAEEPCVSAQMRLVSVAREARKRTRAGTMTALYRMYTDLGVELEYTVWSAGAGAA